jgi:ABC-type glycerol-3-phosphate transport system permease component
MKTTDAIIRKGPQLVLLYTFLIFSSVIMIFPVFWLVTNAFKTEPDIFSMPPVIFPDYVYLDNFSNLFSSQPFFLWYFNSLKVAVMRVVLTLFFCSLGGFALAKYEFRLKKIIMVVVIISLTIPFQVLVIPMFLVMYRLKLLNTHLALILPWIATPFGIFMMRQYMVGIPDSLIDAARVDGATGFWIYLRIILPLSLAGLGALAVVLFVWTWTAYLWPLIILFSPKKFTIPLGLPNLIMFIGGKQLWGQVMAGAALTIVPIIVLFLFTQKYFVKGLTTGSFR